MTVYKDKFLIEVKIKHLVDPDGTIDIFRKQQNEIYKILNQLQKYLDKHSLSCGISVNYMT